MKMKLKLQDKTNSIIILLYPYLLHIHTQHLIFNFFLVLYHEHLEQVVIKTTLVRTQTNLSPSSAWA